MPKVVDAPFYDKSSYLEMFMVVTPVFEMVMVVVQQEQGHNKCGFGRR